MNLIDIGIYFLVFLTGVAFLWFLARFKLIKDIKDKEIKAQSIISSAKNKANRLIKDTEKKVKAIDVLTQEPYFIEDPIVPDSVLSMANVSEKINLPSLLQDKEDPIKCIFLFYYNYLEFLTIIFTAIFNFYSIVI